MFHPALRYQGSVVARPTLGDPRVFGAFVALIALAFVVAAVAGLIDLDHLAIAGFALGAGPVASVDLREQALAKFKEAKTLEVNGEVPAEKTDEYVGLVSEAVELDKAFAKAQKDEGLIASARDSVRDRLAFYQEAVTGQPMRFSETVLDPSRPTSLGAQFVGSKAYKELIGSGALATPDHRFRTLPFIGVPSKFMGAAGDVIQTEDNGPAGDGIVRPLRLPGVLPLPQRPLAIRSLFPNETMTEGDSIEYAAQVAFDRASGLAVKQSTAANDASGLKKQSSIGWELRSARAEWLATYFVVSRQALADVNQVRAAIDNQGRLMLQLEEEDMILGGSGTPPEIEGILNVTGTQTLDLTGEDNLDGIRTARRLVKTGLSRLTPDFIVVNPIDGEEFDLLKDLNGQYRIGNPMSNAFSFDAPIWKLPRVESEAIDEGHALVGAGAGATVYERQGITVTTADQHADFFVRNLVVILFEERLALPVYFPTAFVDVTLGDWES